MFNSPGLFFIYRTHICDTHWQCNLRHFLGQHGEHGPLSKGTHSHVVDGHDFFVQLWMGIRGVQVFGVDAAGTHGERLICMLG